MRRCAEGQADLGPPVWWQRQLPTPAACGKGNGSQMQRLKQVLHSRADKQEMENAWPSVGQSRATHYPPAVLMGACRSVRHPQPAG